MSCICCPTYLTSSNYIQGPYKNDEERAKKIKARIIGTTPAVYEETNKRKNRKILDSISGHVL